MSNAQDKSKPDAASAGSPGSPLCVDRCDYERLLQALKSAHREMFTWCSSEYADHPTSLKAASEIERAENILREKRKMENAKLTDCGK